MKKKVTLTREADLVRERFLMVMNDYIAHDAEINTQQKFGRLLGLTQNRISRFKTQEAAPTVREVMLICYHCNVTPNMMLHGEKKQEYTIADRLDIITTQTNALRRYLVTQSLKG